MQRKVALLNILSSKTSWLSIAYFSHPLPPYMCDTHQNQTLLSAVKDATINAAHWSLNMNWLNCMLYFANAIAISEQYI